MSKQLEDGKKLAEMILSEVRRKETHDDLIVEAMDFLAKYHPKPKDELFEKWKEFADWWQPKGHLDLRDLETFNGAKELGLFTHALDEAIKLHKDSYIFSTSKAHREAGKEIQDSVLESLEEIRTKYSKGEGES